jgi:hypothetical protein
MPSPTPAVDAAARQEVRSTEFVLRSVTFYRDESVSENFFTTAGEVAQRPSSEKVSERLDWTRQCRLARNEGP